jgi:hypothetical protein
MTASDLAKARLEGMAGVGPVPRGKKKPLVQDPRYK